MSANETANALHAGAVIAIGPDEGDTFLFEGAWGFRSAARLSPGVYMLELEQPLLYTAGLGPETNRVAGLPVAQFFAQPPPNTPTVVATLGVDVGAPSTRGHVLVSCYNAAGVLTEPASALISVYVLRSPRG